MPEKTEYAPGTFCWADLATTDAAAAGTFYGALFGWTAEKIDDPAAGGYTMLNLNGKPAAALGPIQNPGQPPAWTAHVAVENVDKTVEIAQSAGATIIAPAMDVFDAGRLSVLADPTGAVFAIWQAGTMPGAAIVDEPNAFSWAELGTRDTAKAQEFYNTVFGWGAKSNDMGGMVYTEFKVGDDSVAGMMALPAEVPAQVPAYWMPYFEVADIDMSFAKATTLGAEAVVAPEEIPQLKFAIVRDPQGAVFGLLQPKRA